MVHSGLYAPNNLVIRLFENGQLSSIIEKKSSTKVTNIQQILDLSKFYGLSAITNFAQ